MGAPNWSPAAQPERCSESRWRLRRRSSASASAASLRGAFVLSVCVAAWSTGRLAGGVAESFATAGRFAHLAGPPSADGFVASSQMQGSSSPTARHARTATPRVQMQAALKKRAAAIKKAQAKAAQRLADANEKKKKDNVIEMNGEVLYHSRNIFKVQLSNGIDVQCSLAGKLRMNKIRVMEGDTVTVEMSPFDLTKGRITFRHLDRRLLETEEEKKQREKMERKIARQNGEEVDED